MAQSEPKQRKSRQDKEEKGWPKNRRGVLYALNREAMLYWHRLFKKTPHAVEFLQSRGFSNPLEIAERYQIGYAPQKEDNKKGFVSYILSKGFSEAKDAEDLERALIAAGLARRAQNGKVYDFFYGRLMFPIQQKGTLDLLPSPDTKILGFGGRVVPHPDSEVSPVSEDGKIERKWMNTSETVIFQKRSVLYGWAWAAGDVQARRACVFMEGYLDVIQAREANYPHVVATLGTSLTEEHLKLLPDSTQSKDLYIYLSTDDDKAGRKSAERSAKLIFESRGTEARVRIARPKDGLDPDDLIRLRGAESYQEVLDSALTPLAQLLKDRGDDLRKRGLVELTSVLREAGEMLSLAYEDRDNDVSFMHDWLREQFRLHVPVNTLKQILTSSNT